jgi:Enoyl-(Acyl carrier protein) reductase
MISNLSSDIFWRSIRADVAVEADVAALITGTAERHGRLDCLVNCAGEGGSPGGIATLDLDRLQRTLAIHLGGTAAGMKHAAPVMTAQRSGSMINVASIGGHVAGWTFLDYSAAKAAVIQLTRSAAAELGQHGVRVNASPRPDPDRHLRQGRGPTRTLPIWSRCSGPGWRPTSRSAGLGCPPTSRPPRCGWPATPHHSSLARTWPSTEGSSPAGAPPRRRPTSPPSPRPCSPTPANHDRPQCAGLLSGRHGQGETADLLPAFFLAGRLRRR